MCHFASLFVKKVQKDEKLNENAEKSIQTSFPECKRQKAGQNTQQLEFFT